VDLFFTLARQAEAIMVRDCTCRHEPKHNLKNWNIFCRGSLFSPSTPPAFILLPVLFLTFPVLCAVNSQLSRLIRGQDA
jgi:hypothetical protein